MGNGISGGGTHSNVQKPRSRRAWPPSLEPCKFFTGKAEGGCEYKRERRLEEFSRGSRRSRLVI